MTDRELMQQALDALLRVWKMDRTFKDGQTIEALRARLAQPEPEPVAWMDAITKEIYWRKQINGDVPNIPLYTAPPQREWKGLTDEEKNAITWGKTVYEILDLAEAKLKEKNNG